MKKIIHLSDTHVGYDNLSGRLAELVTRIIFLKEPAANYIVVLTGDVVEDATRDGSYEEALSHLRRLQDAGFALLVIPGNHDYGTGSLGSKDYIEKFKQYFYGDVSVTYPIKTIIDNIAFIGLDSMEAELHWYDRLFAEGELGKKQLERLSDMLNEADVVSADYRVVYLHHHPFHPRLFHQLKDSRELGEVLIGRNISALLFGHNHEGDAWHGKWGIKRVYDGGTSTAKEGKPSPNRVIDLSQDISADYLLQK